MTIVSNDPVYDNLGFSDYRMTDEGFYMFGKRVVPKDQSLKNFDIFEDGKYY